jgi:hypothetical protein
MASRVSGYSLNKRLKENQAKRQSQTRSRVSGYSKYGTSYNAKNSGSTLGYLGGSLAAGLAGIGEGVADITAATGALLVGDKEYAKYVFKDNVVGDWHQSLTENYNPGAIMGFMGNVAHSMGQSSVMLLDAVGVPVGSVAFYGGMIGQGISNAAEKTGDVGFKEVAYGASVGVAEGILETYLGGAGKAVKNIVGSTFKNVGKNAVRKGLLREILSDAGQEFAEEFASEYVDVFLQRVTGVDKDASTTIKDAAYSGLVGFFSGAMSAGTSDVIRYAATKQKGSQIIASGNAQTLVNTAEAVVNKLAGAGTNFKNTAEWIKVLRADVDAYNKLSDEKKVGAKGAEILGEMHAAVGFAELQAVLGGVQKSIQGESQANREMLAEYINQTVDKAKRKKDYTADDVSDNTDNIATQLAVLKAVGLVDLEGAIADARYESAIDQVIKGEKEAEAAAGEADASAEVRGNSEELKGDSEGIVPNSAENGGIVPEMSGEAEGIVPKADGVVTEDEVIYEDELPVGGTKYSLSTAKSARRKLEQNKARAERLRAKTATESSTESATEAVGAATEAKNEIETESKTEAEGEAVAREAQSGDGGAVEAVVVESGTESKNEAPAEAESGSDSEPVVHEAKEIYTAEQRVEMARERARRWIEWEKRTGPKVAELNAAREAVKGFDDLDITRRLAIVRMIRSAQESGTKVDAKMLKGVANLMAAKTKDGRYFAGDLEVRFAEGIGSRGLHTTVGGKHLILLDPSVKYAETIKGTVAHEIVHYLENRAGYAQLAEFAKKHAKQGSIDEIRAKYDTFYTDMYTAEEQEKGGSEDEIAARVRERMESEEYKSLIDSEIVASLVGEGLKNERFLKRYAEKDDKLIRRVWNWLKGLKASLKDRDREAEKIVDEMALRMDMALQSGVVRESKSGVKHSFSSIAYSFFGDEEIGVEKLEDLSYKKTQGYKDYVEQCLSNMRQSRSEFNEAVARKEIEDGIDGIVRVAVAAKKAGYDIYDSAAQRNTRDSKKRLLFSSLEPNSDYFTSSDISTICDKRKNFTEIEAEINRIEAERGVPREKRFFSDINNYFVLHEILAKHGLTTACRQCYVESMRKNFGRMANAFIDLVTEEDGGNKKNRQLYSPKGELKSGNAEMRERVRALIAEESIPDKYLTFEALTSGEMLAEIRLQHPLLFEAYNSFYGQSKPKMPKAATPFRFGELTALLTDDKGKINKGLVKRIESTGGFRLQSYSDFQIKNYVDVLQVIFEAGTLGLSGHAYTKVPAFLDATAGTNLKRNISIFMYRDGDEWKIDRSDSFPYALDKIYDIVNADKSGDTGIIAVSQNEDMSAYIMANDLIAYGIPFHKSGTKMAVVRETVVREGGREIKGYLGIKDHTRMQSEVYASGENKGKKVKAPINIYSFWDFDNKRMSKKNLIEKNLKAYIDACEEAGYLPKFREYVMNNEKVLSATLSYAKKLGFVGADATIADISFKYKGYVIPYGYYKFLGDFSMFTPDGKASPHEVLSLKGYDFDKAVAFFADSKKLRTNELLQQIDNGPEREKYRKMIESGEMTIAQLGKVIKDKRDEVVAEVVGEKPVVKRDLDPDKKYRAAKKAEPKGMDPQDYIDDPYFAAAVARSMKAEAEEKVRRAQNEAEAFKAENARQWERDKRQKETISSLVNQVVELESLVDMLSAQNAELSHVEGDMVTMRENAKREARRARDQLNKTMEENREMRDEVKAALEEARRVATTYGNLYEGKVYSNAEIERAIDEIVDKGMGAFLGGQFDAKLKGNKRDEIVRYMAIQLNTSGVIGGDKVTGLIRRTARDMINSMVLTDADTGEKRKLSDYFDEAEIDLFAEDIRIDLTNAISSMGRESTYAQLQRRIANIRNEYFLKEQKLEAEVERFKEDARTKANEQKQIGLETPKTYQAALKIKQMAETKQGIGGDATDRIIKELGRIVDTSGHLHLGSIDKAMREVIAFYEGEALKMSSVADEVGDDKMTSFAWGLDPNIKAMAEAYLKSREQSGNKAISSEELKLVGDVLRGMKKMLETYNKEYIGNRYVDLDAATSGLIADLKSFVGGEKEYGTKVGKLLGKAMKWAKEEYFYKILSPETVVDALEGYKKNGTLHTLYHAIRVARTNADDMAYRMKDPFAKYIDDKENRWQNKDGKERSYRDKLNEKMVVVNGVEITLGEAIYLYMLTKRDHSHRGLKESGYITYDDNGKKKATIKVEDPTGTRTEIGNQLDAKDRKFIDMAEEFFNVTASKIKYDADMKIFGYTNNQPGYYVPIVRDRYSRTSGVTDARQGIDSIVTVYAPSFTQNLVANAKALEGKSILRLINDHADGLGAFSELYIPMKAFDRVYNHGVLTEDGIKTVREVLEQDVWNGAHGYFKDVFQDIQGQRKKSDSTIDKIVGKARSSWVNSVLGANLKVVATQTTSLAAATQVIEPKYITRSLAVLTPGRDMSELGARADKYSRLIGARSFEMGALKAQGNIDKVTAIGEKAGYLIGWMDRRVCLAVFHAAEIKVEETMGFSIGSEENAKEAAKIADETIYSTQAMDSMAEKSALQRETSEISKLFSMFTSDTVKNLSHLYGNVMKYVAHKERAKTDATYAAELKKDAGDMKRSMRTLLVTGIMLGLITQAFKYIYGTQEDEPEERVEDFALDIVGSTLNILPIVSDVIDKLAFDYDLSINVLDVANDTLDAVRDGFGVAGKAMSGQYVSAQDGAKAALNIAKSVAANLGVPVSPAEKTVMAVLRRLTPKLGYTLDDLGANLSYTSDLKAAVEKGDERLAEHVLSKLYKDEVAGVYTSEELEEVVRLYNAGYTGVLPQRIGDEVNGVKLDRKQRKQFNAIYSEASGKVDAMIRTASFAELTDEQRAKAIKNLYTLYYSRAASEVTGKEWSNAQAYAALLDDPTTLFVAQAYKSGLEGYSDASGKEVTVKSQFVSYAQSLGLSEGEYAVVAYANGVRDKQTRADILKYINSLGLSDEVKKLVAERLGFAITNGAVVEA